MCPKWGALLGILFLGGCQSALPPGYQDEIYCPPLSCLREKKQHCGWSGPQLAFRECCRTTDGQVVRPRAFGYKLDPQIKVDLLAAHWHSTWCAAEEAGICSRSSVNKSSTAHAWLYNKAVPAVFI